MSGANGNDSPVSSDADDGDGVQGSSDQWVTRCVCDDNSQVVFRLRIMMPSLSVDRVAGRFHDRMRDMSSLAAWRLRSSTIFALRLLLYF